jgi:hypothetical protein
MVQIHQRMIWSIQDTPRTFLWGKNPRPVVPRTTLADNFFSFTRWFGVTPLWIEEKRWHPRIVGQVSPPHLAASTSKCAWKQAIICWSICMLILMNYKSYSSKSNQPADGSVHLGCGQANLRYQFGLMFGCGSCLVFLYLCLMQRINQLASTYMYNHIIYILYVYIYMYIYIFVEIHTKNPGW